MLIQCDNGYEYELKFDGTHYVATDTKRGHVKRRLNVRCWYNDYSRRMTDIDTIDKLEAGVRQLQSVMATTPHQCLHNPRPPVIPPTREPVRRAKAREWRGEARS